MTLKANTFSVRLPDDVRNKVDELARVNRRSRSSIIQEAVSAYVAERTDYLRDLDEAMKSVESGIGHSGDQIFGWMRSWGKDGEASSPEPDVAPSERSGSFSPSRRSGTWTSCEPI